MHEHYLGPVIKKISEEIERQANEDIKDYRVTLTQGKVILFLSEYPDKKATQKELEDFLQVSHPTTVTIVKSMEAKNMVETYFDDTDRRMKIVKLVWGNEKLYDELRQNAENMEYRLLDGFSEQEKKQFRSLLNKAYKNVVK